jgi:hypothetical protein
VVRNIITLAVLLGFAGCGEFHTQKYFGDISVPDGFDRSICEVWLQADLRGPGSVQLVQHEPATLFLTEVGLPAGYAVSYEIATGKLPKGLLLSPDKGTISGFPAESGTFVVTILADDIPDGAPCIGAATLQLNLEVLPGCLSDEDCLAADGFVATCEEPGRCVLSPLADGCPTALGSTVDFSLAVAPVDLADIAFEVISHHTLSREELVVPGLAGFTHQLLLGADEETLWTLPYRLTDNWPLPFATGEEISLHLDILMPSRLTLLGADGGPVAVLHDGPLAEVGAESGTAADGFDLGVKRRHLSCPVTDDNHQCGPRGHDSLIFSTAGGEEELTLVTGEDAELTIEKAPYTLAVASSFTHLPTQFDCSYVTPSSSSFHIFPLDTCPIARIASPSPKVLRSAKDMTSVTLEGTKSFAHLDGEIMAYQWTLADQPYTGLVELTYPVAGVGAANAWFSVIQAAAVGTYNILLEVVDQDGRKSCAAALSQVSVLAATEVDLRVELIWRTESDALAVEGDLDLLLMHPTYASLLGDTQWDSTSWEGSEGEKWVCSEKNPSPTNWAALPEEEGTLCQVSGGQLTEGRPEVATVEDLDKDKKTNRYSLGVRASSDNPGIVFAGIRVFLGGVPKYETSRQPLLPGQLWLAGHVDVEFMKFVPRKNGK